LELRRENAEFPFSIPFPSASEKKIENRKMESLKLKNRENKAWHFRNKKKQIVIILKT